MLSPCMGRVMVLKPSEGREIQAAKSVRQARSCGVDLLWRSGSIGLKLELTCACVIDFFATQRQHARHAEDGSAQRLRQGHDATQMSRQDLDVWQKLQCKSPAAIAWILTAPHLHVGTQTAKHCRLHATATRLTETWRAQPLAVALASACVKHGRGCSRGCFCESNHSDTQSRSGIHASSREPPLDLWLHPQRRASRQDFAAWVHGASEIRQTKAATASRCLGRISTFSPPLPLVHPLTLHNRLVSTYHTTDQDVVQEPFRSGRGRCACSLRSVLHAQPHSTGCERQSALNIGNYPSELP